MVEFYFLKCVFVSGISTQVFIGFLGWTAGFIRSQIALILSTGFPSVCNQGTISFYDKLQGIESSRNSLLGFYYFTPKMYQNFIEHPIILRCKSFFFKGVGILLSISGAVELAQNWVRNHLIEVRIWVRKICPFLAGG